MIVRLRHVLALEHPRPVAHAAHLLRLCPRTLAWQRVRRCTLSAVPTASKQRDGVDHFGNPVAWMFHDFVHDRLEIASDLLVELLARPAPPATPPWEQVADAARNKAWAWREAEFAFPSPAAPATPEARAFAAPSFPPGRPIAEAASCLAGRALREFRLVPAVAAPGTLARVFAERAGSCRDVAHALISGLRSLGLPARSASGYAITEFASSARLHAWMNCWLGPGLGWLDLDPFGAGAGERVCLGWGRDHGDVTPARGVLSGNAVGSFTDRVSIEQIGTAERA